MKTVNREFPDSFLWGGAIAANQADGASLLGGKGFSIADYHPYIKKEMRDDRREDAAIRNDENCLKIDSGLYYPKQYGIDFYHRFREDLRLMKEMGMKCFRTSFDWSRIYPRGDENYPNQEGLDYYDELIDTIRECGMEPVMTISHYEMPIHLVKAYGGWLGRKTVECFERYCDTLFKRYHGKVRYWITFNQINLLTFNSLGILGDRADNFKEAVYQGVHHQFVASAIAKKTALSYSGDLLVGTMGKLMGGSFERIFALCNAKATQYTTTIPVLVYRWGIGDGKFSEATALGLFQSVIGLILVLAADWVAKKLGEDGLI